MQWALQFKITPFKILILRLGALSDIALIFEV